MPDLKQIIELMTRAYNWQMAGDRKAAEDFANEAMLALFGLDA